MTQTAAQDPFVPYPINRVVGTIADARDERSAVEALLKAGFRIEDLGILQGEDGQHRLDLTGSEHGALARVQRSVMRTLAGPEQYRHLQHYVDDVRAGRTVVTVLAPSAGKRAMAVDILRAHGAQSLRFFGRWAIETIGTGGMAKPLEPVEKARRTYEARAENMSVLIELTSETSALVTDSASEGARSQAATVATVRTDLLLLSWQDEGKTTFVQVLDLAQHAAFTTVTGPDGTSRLIVGDLHEVGATDPTT